MTWELTVFQNCDPEHQLSSINLYQVSYGGDAASCIWKLFYLSNMRETAFLKNYCAFP